MKISTLQKIVQAKKEAEKEIGFTVDNRTAREVLRLCVRKCKCASKGEDYLPLMFRYELPMKIEAEMLNEIGKINRERRVESVV